MNLAMGRISDSLTVLYFALAAGIYLKPEYSIFNSRVATAALIFGVITASKLVYRLVLYPDYFTPLKHIYSPAVGQPSFLGFDKSA
jgi:hypothetical protein